MVKHIILWTLKPELSEEEKNGCQHKGETIYSTKNLFEF